MEAMPEDWERAVAVAAHPDDLEYGMASAVARFTAQGKRGLLRHGHERRGWDRQSAP